jgi:hypothetical protein
MPTFGQQFWQGFTEVNALRDYTHASKVFTPNSFELKPRYKFLFHVSFTVNQIPGLNNFLGTNDQTQLSYVVKTVDLPKFTINNETLNQYNRKRVIQTKVNYDPVNITFHDDGGDNVRKMWYAYYNYYYKDADQPYLDVPTGTQLGQVGNKINAFGYNKRDIYSPTRESNVNDWGYIGESFKDGNNPTGGKPPFFKDIQIYGFDQHKTATLIQLNKNTYFPATHSPDLLIATPSITTVTILVPKDHEQCWCNFQPSSTSRSTWRSLSDTRVPKGGALLCRRHDRVRCFNSRIGSS